MTFPPRLLLCLLLPCAALAGAEPAPSRVLKLTLATALQQALAQNFSIKVDEFGPQIAREEVRVQLGRFDPLWDARAVREDLTDRNTLVDGFRLPVQGVSRVDSLSSGLRGVTGLGTEYNLRVGSVGQTGSVVDNAYRSTGLLELTQPLLRDAGPAVNLAGVRIARRSVKVSEWKLRKSIIDVMTETDFVYNELQLSIEKLKVAIRSRELARQLLKDNEARVKIGVKSPLDVTEASAQVASREEGVILAQREVMDNENLLKKLVTSDMLGILDTRVEIAKPPSPHFDANVTGGVRDALELRPDYRQALLELEQQKIRVAVQKNALLPRIDLVGSLSILGLDNEFGDSFGRFRERDQAGWSAGVVFSIPLGNRTARGDYSKAKLAAAQQLMNLQALEQQIIVEVDNGSGQIVTSRERIRSTGEARRLARETLDAGEERLRAGTGTTFEVLELQNKLAEAEIAELRAIADYNKAIGEYHRTTGTTLRENNVALE